MLQDNDNNLDEIIRYGKMPNRPDLISRWLTSHTIESAQQRCHWQYYEHQFYLLLETIMDALIAIHWRQCCLDHLYIPLKQLQSLVVNAQQQRQLSALWHEFQLSTHYIQQQLQRSEYYK